MSKGMKCGFIMVIYVVGSVHGLLAQTKLYYEAEAGILSGTASIANCTSASGGEMVRDIDAGIANALEIRDVDVPEARSYFVTVSYFAVNGRTLAYNINDGNSKTITLPASGALWCYQGGQPADFTFQDEFAAGKNNILFYDSPIIDKIVISSDTTARQPSAFYISAMEGNDNNDGLSSNSAWQSFKKVNSLALVPGDSLLFRTGDTFTGKLSLINEGGEIDQPILISNYGSGEKPIFDGDGYLSTIHVVNSGYIHISNIEIKNDGGESKPGVPDELRYGMYFENTFTDGTKFDHYRLQNLTFKNIYPTTEVTDDDNTGVNAHAIITSGSWGDDINPTRFSDMLIENCYFTRTARHATLFKAIDNLVIKNNLFEHVGGAGMVIGNNCTDVLVEHNVTNYTGSKIDSRMAGRGSGIWCYRSKNLTVQHNKFMHARGIHDSYGMHIDIGNRNVVYQYNYSEDNEGGFVEILGANVNVGYRYNLSVGDGWRKRGNRYGQVFWLAGWSGDPENPIGSDSVFIYNNSIYVRDTIAPGIWIEDVTKHARIYNNIIYVPKAFGPVVIKNAPDLNDFDHNIWYGDIPTMDEDGELYRGSNAMTSDPMYQSPIVTDSLGFILKPNSPAIGSGKLIFNAGISHDFDYYSNNGGIDYYGNPVLSKARPNVGAYNVGGDIVITRAKDLFSTPQFKLYPNPIETGKVINIDVPQGLGQGKLSVKIIGITGIILREKVYRRVSKISFETSNLKSGYYLIKIVGKGGQLTQMVLIL